MPWHPLTPALGLPFVSSSGSSPQEGLCDPAPPFVSGPALACLLQGQSSLQEPSPPSN